MKNWILAFAFGLAGFTFAADTRPNIVWIVADDMSCDTGAYGCKDAITPNLDRLAKEGALFKHAFTHTPVCAPSRSGLITGRYPTTLGTHHMRSTLLKTPELFTDLMRKAGYKVLWPGKTDFNFEVPKSAFDSQIDWRKAPLPKDGPFFAYVNLAMTHESQVRSINHEQKTKRLKPAERRDPAKVSLPPYYPDTPVVRRGVANYHECVTLLDYAVGDVLKKLEDEKLAENTVVIFFGDHGWGMPRGKRWLYDSGVKVPLIVRWPGRINAGSVREELVAFVDFAPTMLALAGVEIPAYMQGQVFLGPKTAKEREYVFGARDRMDETYDRIRYARDKRFKYIRNFEPQIPYAQYQHYNYMTPTLREWYRLAAEGKLEGPQKIWWSPTKPKEELYDCDADPHEVVNLAEKPEHAETLARLRAALDKWIADTKDLGATSETELIKQGLVKDRLSTEYNLRDTHSKNFPFPPTVDAAGLKETDWLKNEK